MATNTKSRAEEAVRQFRLAERLQRKRPIDFSERALNPLWAEQAREEGLRLLESPPQLTGSAGTELVPTAVSDERLTDARMQFLETLAEPNTIAVTASEQRADLATRAGVLSAAIDAAVSARAEGSIEKMLCHQLAAVHAAGMRLLVRLEEVSTFPPTEIARLTNAAARLFEVYQGGNMALQKLKLGGTQRVVAQYQQHVEAGGQAVAAGRIKRGSRKRGRRHQIA